MIDFKALAAPFPPSAVSWRVGRVNEDKRSALCLAYLDARDIMDRLDSVCGPAGWQCPGPPLCWLLPTQCLAKRYPTGLVW